MANEQEDDAPLMAGHEADAADVHHNELDSVDDDNHGGGGGGGPGGRPKKESPDQPSLFVWLLTIAAGISGLLFGYDTGVISATLVSIGTALSDRELTSLDKSIITSSTSLFALLISPFSSVLADNLGRKKVILLADVLFMAGALLQAVSSSVPAMVAGRCVVGAGVGAASFVVPLYIAEVAPAAYRGRLVTTNVLFITLGQVVAYLVGWAFAELGDPATGWRWMVGLGALPAAVQAGLVVFMPETPRWLVKMGRPAQARAVVVRVAGGGPPGTTLRRADSVVAEIEAGLRDEQMATRLQTSAGDGRFQWLGIWRELLTVGRNRRALAIACLLQGLQQLCGFNSLMYFSATIFTMVGFSIPTLTSLSVAGTNLAFTVVALLLIDRVGRRRILLYSIPFMIAGLLLAAFGFSFISVKIDAMASDITEAAPATGVGEKNAAVVILMSIMLYVASYAIGLGNVPWMQSELFPLAMRSLGSGIATGTNWLANFIIGLTFLPLMDALSPSWTFVLYSVICGVGYALVWAIYPETAGLSLEETALLLENGWR